MFSEFEAFLIFLLYCIISPKKMVMEFPSFFQTLKLHSFPVQDWSISYCCLTNACVANNYLERFFILQDIILNKLAVGNTKARALHWETIIAALSCWCSAQHRITILQPNKVDDATMDLWCDRPSSLGSACSHLALLSPATNPNDMTCQKGSPSHIT